MSHVTTATVAAAIEDVIAAAIEWGVDAALIIIHPVPVQMTGYAEGRTATLTIAARALQKALGIPAWSDLGAEVRPDGTVELHVDGHQWQHIGGAERVGQDVVVARLVRAAAARGVAVEVTYQTAADGRRIASLRRAQNSRTRGVSRERSRARN